MTMVEVDNEHRLITTRQAYELLTVSRRGFFNLVGRGELKPIVLGPKTHRYRLSDIIDLIEKRSGRSRDDIVEAAFQFMAERQAEEERALCPRCTRRRVNRSGSFCTFCEQERETQLLHKRNWYQANATDFNEAKRAKRRETNDGE
jgi:predicted DNA-binding transcriptional regulator AlpA